MKKFIITESERENILNLYKSKSANNFLIEGNITQPEMDKMITDTQKTMSGLVGQFFITPTGKISITKAQVIGDVNSASVYCRFEFGASSLVDIYLVSQKDGSVLIGRSAAGPGVVNNKASIYKLLQELDVLKGMNGGDPQNQTTLGNIVTNLNTLINMYKTTGTAA